MVHGKAGQAQSSHRSSAQRLGAGLLSPGGARLCLGDPVPLWLMQLQAQSLTSKRAWDSTALIPALQNAVLEAE